VQAAGGVTARRLEDAGLTFTPGQRLGTGLLTALPLVAVLVALGLPRLVSGLSTGRPTDYLVVTLLIGAGVALTPGSLRPFRTRRGDLTLDALQARHRLLKHSTTRAAEGPGQVGLAVALFGTAALIGSETAGLSDLHRWCPKQTDEGGGFWAGCSGGDGGGGGCGAAGAAGAAAGIDYPASSRNRDASRGPFPWSSCLKKTNVSAQP
jgi:hypothetical protein